MDLQSTPISSNNSSNLNSNEFSIDTTTAYSKYCGHYILIVGYRQGNKIQCNNIHFQQSFKSNDNCNYDRDSNNNKNNDSDIESSSDNNNTYDFNKLILLYLDPARTSQVLEISALTLDIARKHPGTDSDVIIIV